VTWSAQGGGINLDLLQHRRCHGDGSGAIDVPHTGLQGKGASLKAAHFPGGYAGNAGLQNGPCCGLSELAGSAVIEETVGLELTLDADGDLGAFARHLDPEQAGRDILEVGIKDFDDSSGLNDNWDCCQPAHSEGIQIFDLQLSGGRRNLGPSKSGGFGKALGPFEQNAVGTKSAETNLSHFGRDRPGQKCKSQQYLSLLRGGSRDRTPRGGRPSRRC